MTHFHLFPQACCLPGHRHLCSGLSASAILGSDLHPILSHSLIPRKIFGDWKSHLRRTPLFRTLYIHQQNLGFRIRLSSLRLSRRCVWQLGQEPLETSHGLTGNQCLGCMAGAPGYNSVLDACTVRWRILLGGLRSRSASVLTQHIFLFLSQDFGEERMRYWVQWCCPPSPCPLLPSLLLSSFLNSPFYI